MLALYRIIFGSNVRYPSTSNEPTFFSLIYFNLKYLQQSISSILYPVAFLKPVTMDNPMVHNPTECPSTSNVRCTSILKKQKQTKYALLQKKGTNRN